MLLSANIVPVLLLCLCDGLNFWGKSILAGRVNAAALFTIVTAAALAFTLLAGALFQKEKITVKTVLSFTACLCAIFCQAGAL